jgi:hypothetical protein
MTKISTKFFACKLRPFFDPQLIGNKWYSAAGAAQMPIIWIDLLLWAMEGAPWSFWEYFFDNLEYQPLPMREKAEDAAELPSLLRSALREAGARSLTPDAIKSLEALVSLLDQIIRFRGKHLVTAKRSKMLRPVGAKGSSGYDLEDLIFLLEQIKAGRHEALRQLRRA